MKNIKSILFSIVAVISANLFSLFVWLGAEWGQVVPGSGQILLYVLSLAGFVGINFFPGRRSVPSGRIRILYGGTELLRIFLLSASVTTVWQIYFFLWNQPYFSRGGPAVSALILVWLGGLLGAVLCEGILFWNGMIRVFVTSVQLGFRYRILAVFCGWIPVVNVFLLCRILRILEEEVEIETQKWERNASRAENEICGTRYPILLVHGVFFRDSKYLNYWGRIPRELQKNGATVYYGEQQSADTVEDCGAELAEKIKEITEKTGCGKVNIIAHSKGGLDSRAAISHFGAAPYVASLTTINTPHRGCIFAEHLLNTTSEKVRDTIADTYNAALKQLGDPEPDFLGAVTDLTETRCLERNETTPDVPEILYESVMSYCRKAKSGRFPLNISYPLVKRLDGKNDGLVSVDSARWGSRFTLLEPQGKRGISHGDMIDLNRENIPGFDVREFYVSLAAELKQRGY